MKDISLDTNQRMHISVVVGLQEGKASDILVYSRLLEKLKLSETEEALIGLTVDPVAGNMSWRPHPEGVPPVTVQIEDADASKLKYILENWPRFAARDHEWLQKVMAQL